MSVSSIVVAALPIPVTSFGLIPTFKAQTKFLSVYTSLFCFLLLAYVFYRRHALAKTVFKDYLANKSTMHSNAVKTFLTAFKTWIINIFPLLLILFSLCCVLMYHSILTYKINEVGAHLLYREIMTTGNFHSYLKNDEEQMDRSVMDFMLNNSFDAVKRNIILIPTSNTSINGPGYEWLLNKAEKYSTKEVLSNGELHMIEKYYFLILLYLGIFLSAEAAFILMAIKEYLQEVIGIEEIKLIKRNYDLNDS